MTKGPLTARVYITKKFQRNSLYLAKKIDVSRSLIGFFHLKNTLKRQLNRLALATLSSALFLVRLFSKAIRPLFPGSCAIARFVLRFFILPPYRWLVIGRLRFSKILASTHGLLFFLFTNRYVTHAVLVIIAVFAFLTQLQTKSAVASSEDRQSLLYTLATQGEDEIVEESALPGVAKKNTRYFGSETLIAFPSIDFDYGDMDEGAPADLTIPGSIALQPETMGDQAEPIQIARSKTELYTIQPGDSLGVIARRFGVNVGTLLWANKLTATSLLRPGDILKIPPVSGLLHVVKKGDTIEKIANLYRVKPGDVLSANHITESAKIAVGDELVVPGGTPPAPAAPKTIAKKLPSKIRTDVPISRISNKSFDLYQELTIPANDTRVKPPDKDTSTLPATKLLWPSRLRVITQYFGWRHTGIDVDGDYTDPVYAAEDGIVEKSGWNTGGYGLMIVIRHDNGMKTRYSHVSKIFVQEGERVKRGQVIAMIGTTGRSTGTHLHFEVYTADGVRRNPLAYTK